MLDKKALLPELQKMLPQYSIQELSAGMQEFEQTHPDLNNQQALQAVTAALSQQKQSASSGEPFQGLVSQFGGK